MKAYIQALHRYLANPSPSTATNLPYLEGIASATWPRPQRRRRLRGWVVLVLVVAGAVALSRIPEGQPTWSSSAAIESEVNGQ